MVAPCPLCSETLESASVMESHLYEVHHVNSNGAKRIIALLNSTVWSVNNDEQGLIYNTWRYGQCEVAMCMGCNISNGICLIGADNSHHPETGKTENAKEHSGVKGKPLVLHSLPASLSPPVSTPSLYSLSLLSLSSLLHWCLCNIFHLIFMIDLQYQMKQVILLLNCQRETTLIAASSSWTY